MGLFSVRGDECAALTPSVFGGENEEKRLQLWADRCPSLINDGQPMLSLGIEIVTKHGQYIDNLFIDGDGTLVAAEVKKGKTPRNVLAQLIQYSTYTAGLDWNRVEGYCLKRQNKELDHAFRHLFGRSLVRSPKPRHRLLVVAESFMDQVIEESSHLISHGMALALVQFTYFRVGVPEIIGTTVICGEIPSQAPPGEAIISATPTSSNEDMGDIGPPKGDHSYSAWLLPIIANNLEQAADRYAWNIDFKVNKQSITIRDKSWLLGLGDCQLRVDTYKANIVALRLSFKKALAPSLVEFLAEHKSEWADAFAGNLETPSYETAYACYTLDFQRPVNGDAEAAGFIFAALERAAVVILPLVSTYFRQEVTKPG